MAGLLMNILVAVHEFVGSLASQWTALNALVDLHYGPLARWGLWILLGWIGVHLLCKATRMAIRFAWFVVMPSVVGAVLLMMLVPVWSPVKTLPVLMGCSTMMMILRSR